MKSALLLFALVAVMYGAEGNDLVPEQALVQEVDDSGLVAWQPDGDSAESEQPWHQYDNRHEYADEEAEEDEDGVVFHQLKKNANMESDDDIISVRDLEMKPSNKASLAIEGNAMAQVEMAMLKAEKAPPQKPVTGTQVQLNKMVAPEKPKPPSLEDRNAHQKEAKRTKLITDAFKQARHQMRAEQDANEANAFKPIKLPHTPEIPDDEVAKGWLKSLDKHVTQERVRYSGVAHPKPFAKVLTPDQNAAYEAMNTDTVKAQAVQQPVQQPAQQPAQALPHKWVSESKTPPAGVPGGPAYTPTEHPKQVHVMDDIGTVEVKPHKVVLHPVRTVVEIDDSAATINDQPAPAWASPSTKKHSYRMKTTVVNRKHTAVADSVEKGFGHAEHVVTNFGESDDEHLMEGGKHFKMVPTEKETSWEEDNSHAKDAKAAKAALSEQLEAASHKAKRVLKGQNAKEKKTSKKDEQQHRPSKANCKKLIDAFRAHQSGSSDIPTDKQLRAMGFGKDVDIWHRKCEKWLGTLQEVVTAEEATPVERVATEENIATAAKLHGKNEDKHGLRNGWGDPGLPTTQEQDEYNEMEGDHEHSVEGSGFGSAEAASIAASIAIEQHLQAKLGTAVAVLAQEHIQVEDKHGPLTADQQQTFKAMQYGDLTAEQSKEYDDMNQLTDTPTGDHEHSAEGSAAGSAIAEVLGEQHMQVKNKHGPLSPDQQQTYKAMQYGDLTPEQNKEFNDMNQHTDTPTDDHEHSAEGSAAGSAIAEALGEQHMQVEDKHGLRNGWGDPGLPTTEEADEYNEMEGHHEHSVEGSGFGSAAAASIADSVAAEQHLEVKRIDSIAAEQHLELTPDQQQTFKTMQHGDLTAEQNKAYDTYDDMKHTDTPTDDELTPEQNKAYDAIEQHLQAKLGTAAEVLGEQHMQVKNKHGPLTADQQQTFKAMQYGDLTPEQMKEYNDMEGDHEHSAEGSAAGSAAAEVPAEVPTEVPTAVPTHSGFGSAEAASIAASIAAEQHLEVKLATKGPCDDPAFSHGDQDPAFKAGSHDPAFSHGCPPPPAPAPIVAPADEETGSPAGSPVSVHMNYSKVDLHPNRTNATIVAHALHSAGGSHGHALVLPPAPTAAPVVQTATSQAMASGAHQFESSIASTAPRVDFDIEPNKQKAARAAKAAWVKAEAKAMKKLSAEKAAVENAAAPVQTTQTAKTTPSKKTKTAKKVPAWYHPEHSPVGVPAKPPALVKHSKKAWSVEDWYRDKKKALAEKKAEKHAEIELKTKRTDVAGETMKKMRQQLAHWQQKMKVKEEKLQVEQEMASPEEKMEVEEEMASEMELVQVKDKFGFGINKALFGGDGADYGDYGYGGHDDKEKKEEKKLAKGSAGGSGMLIPAAPLAADAPMSILHHMAGGKGKKMEKKMFQGLNQLDGVMSTKAKQNEKASNEKAPKLSPHDFMSSFLNPARDIAHNDAEKDIEDMVDPDENEQLWQDADTALKSLGFPTMREGGLY